MEKLGQLLAQDKWDLVVVDTPPSRNALDFLDDAPEAAGQLHGRPAVAPAAGARSWLRADRHGRRRPGHEGPLDGARFPNAFRCFGFRAITGCDVRWLPGEGRPDLRTAQAARHPVRRGVGGRTGRPARGRLLRRPVVEGEHAAGRAHPQPDTSDVVLADRRARDRRRRGAEQADADSLAAGCCGCMRTGR